MSSKTVIQPKVARAPEKDFAVVVTPPPSPPSTTGLSTGQWSSNCCDCCADCCICCAGLWCPCSGMAQVYVKATGKKGLFGAILALLWVSYIAYNGFSMYYNNEVNQRLRLAMAYNAWGILFDATYYTPQYLIATTGSFFAYIGLMVLTTCILCIARKAIKVRDQIPEDDCTTCCISCCPCSSPCSLCQLMRHEGMKDSNYNLCDPEGGAVKSATLGVEV